MLILVFLFMTGSIIGSFLNVLIYRESWKESLGGRSKCPNCKKTLKWYELIPIISYLAQNRKCRSCKQKISIQYLLVEVLTGGLFVLAFIFTTNYISFIIFIIALFFIIPLAVCDLKTKTLPTVYLYPFVVYGLAIAIYLFIDTGSTTPLFAGLFLALPFALISLITKERAFGWGDSILALPVGFIIASFEGVILTFILSFWIGAICVAVWYSFNKIFGKGSSFHRKTQVPFGPFLIVAFVTIYFLQSQQIDLIFFI